MIFLKQTEFKFKLIYGTKKKDRSAPILMSHFDSLLGLRSVPLDQILSFQYQTDISIYPTVTESKNPNQAEALFLSF